MKADFPLERFVRPEVVQDHISPAALRIYQHGCWLVVQITGEFDLELVPVIPPLVAPAGVVFDLREVTFMDCAALGVVASTSRTVQRAGGSVRVVVTSPRLCRLFALTGVDRAVTPFDSLEQALAAPVSAPPAAFA